MQKDPANKAATPPGNAMRLRKYPNRRYYDASRSRYLTLSEILGAIREGIEIEVTDSRSGSDITAKVLAQIILELDPSKLDVFPVPLLHRLIRSNEQLVNDFVDRYFNQALSIFLESKRNFEQTFRQTIGLSPGADSPPDWLRRMWTPLLPPAWPAIVPAKAKDSPVTPVTDDPNPADGERSHRGTRQTDPSELLAMIGRLQKQVEALQSRAGGERPTRRGSRGAGKKKSVAAQRKGTGREN